MRQLDDIERGIDDVQASHGEQFTVKQLMKTTGRNHLEIRMSCQNLNLEIKGEVPLPHGINADDGISKP